VPSWIAPEEHFESQETGEVVDTTGLELDGRDLFSDAPAPDRIVAAWGSMVSVRDNDWNLIMDPTQPEEGGRLYELQADPDESHDVYGDHPDAVAELTAFLETTCGPLPHAINHHGDPRQVPPWVARLRKS
jgi:arylsulfatase A-like enzyme